MIFSFWDVDVSGYTRSDGGRGLTTAQMQSMETYSLNGWGGLSEWKLLDGQDYPRLAWESTGGQAIIEPVIPFSGMPNNYSVGQGMLGQPKLYMDQQPVRNFFRYLLP